MIRTRRVATACTAAAVVLLSAVGVAYADDYDPSDDQARQQSGHYTPDTDPTDTDSSDDADEHGCIPENDHSSTDLYRYPDCPGHRDSRDDEGHPGPEHRGELGFL